MISTLNSMMSPSRLPIAPSGPIALVVTVAAAFALIIAGAGGCSSEDFWGKTTYPDLLETTVVVRLPLEHLGAAGHVQKVFASYAPRVERWAKAASKGKAWAPKGESPLEIDTVAGFVSPRGTDGRVPLSRLGVAMAMSESAGVMKGYKRDQYSIIAAGQLYVVGDNQGNPWKLGLRDPFADEQVAFAALDVDGKGGLAVFNQGLFGDRYQGDEAAESKVASVTVLASSPIEAAAISELLMAMSAAEGLALLNSVEGVEGIIMGKDKQAIYTPGLEELLSFREDL